MSQADFVARVASSTLFPPILLSMEPIIGKPIKPFAGIKICSSRCGRKVELASVNERERNKANIVF